MRATDDGNSARRTARSRQAAQAAYDRLSGWYDLLAGSEYSFNQRGLELLAVRPGERVLDFGCGTGQMLQELSARGCWSVGVDLSFGMARAASRRLRKKRLWANALLSQGDGALLPFPDGCFDAVLTTFTLELFNTPEIPVVLQEIGRVLKEGGRLGVVALSLPERPGVMVRVYEWFHRALPAYVDCRPIPAARYVEQNGFLIQQVECKMMWGLPVEIVVGLKSHSTHGKLHKEEERARHPKA